VGGVAIDGVGQIGLRPGLVTQVVDAHLGGQIEQLGRLGGVVYGLGAGLIENDQLVELVRLPVGLPEAQESLRMCRI
jgi:hypothetical protein